MSMNQANVSVVYYILMHTYLKKADRTKTLDVNTCLNQNKVLKPLKCFYGLYDCSGNNKKKERTLLKSEIKNKF